MGWLRTLLPAVGLLLAGCVDSGSVAETDGAKGIDDACRGPALEDRMCTQQYAPVCGCDGRTYGNACMATAAGIQRVREGECGQPENPAT